MQATIYVTQKAMATAIAIKDMDYYTRVSMSDDSDTGIAVRPGYHLKNASKLNLAVLPANAHVALTLSPTSPAPFARVVSMPANLRGCIFERAPNLPPQYAEIVTFWSGEPINANDSRAVHFQSPLNEYLVELHSASSETEEFGETTAVDKLLSEGVVVSITGTAALIDGLAPDDFVEIVMPIDQSIVGIEPDEFRSAKAYKLTGEAPVEHIFVTVADIRRSSIASSNSSSTAWQRLGLQLIDNAIARASFQLANSTAALLRWAYVVNQFDQFSERYFFQRAVTENGTDVGVEATQMSLTATFAMDCGQINCVEGLF